MCARGCVVRSIGRALLIVVVAAALQACGFRFLESYDASIESGVSDYHQSTIDYLSRIIQNPSAPENDYTSPASQTYYASSTAQLSDLVVKADTDAGPKCLPDQLNVLEGYVQKTVANATKNAATSGIADVELSAGTCTAVAMRVMQADHKRMQAMHQRRKLLGTFNAQLWSDLVDDSTRVALVIVKATKPQGTQ
jgi:hypothetical protein